MVKRILELITLLGFSILRGLMNMKRGGKRKNAGRKSAWNSTDNSTTIRVPENLAESL